MKKVIFLSVMLIALLASCNKCRENEVEMNQEAEFTALKEQLTALTTNLQDNGYVATKAKWWKYLLTAAADAGGFFLSGGIAAGPAAVQAGCTASTLVWSIIKEEKKVETKAGNRDVDTSDFNDPSVALTCVDGPGLVHNKVILDLYEENGEELFGYSDEILLPLIAEKVADETNSNVEETALSLQEQKEIVYKTVDAYSTSSTIDEFIDKLEVSAPERVALLEIVQVILTGFDSIDVIADNGNYYNDVQRIITESEISDEAKQILNSTTSVANASSRLWKVE